MFSITYVSAATTAMSDDDIAAILVKSRANNVRLGLTGALLFRQGRFIQILEGPVEQVHEQFAVIAADPRHSNLQKIRETVLVERQFPDWTMGFRPLSDQDVKKLRGYDDFFDGHTGQARIDHANNPTHQLLEWLAEYWFSPA